MKDPVGHGPFQQIPIVTIFLQRSSLYPSTKMTSCTQINSGWFRRHNVLYSRTTRWRGPYYQFCLAKLLILFFLLLLSSFLMMFFSFIQHQQQKINHSEETITHKHRNTFTTLMLLFWALNVGIINFRIQPKIYFEKWGSSNGNKWGFSPSSKSFWFLPPESSATQTDFFDALCATLCCD